MAPQPDATAATYPAPADGNYTTYYDSLAPYGSWVNVDGYGACWQPTVVIINAGWRPYCHGGRWVYSDCGWYWLSGYSWGWAPFHYGRWFCHSRIGWCWQPGYTWGPAWVSWRYSGNYCGWAPLPPAAGFSVGVGLTYHGQRVNSGFAFGLSSRSYTFVPVNHFADPHPNRYAVPRQQAPQVYSQTVASTTVVGNSTRVVNRGIPVSRVEAATRTRIQAGWDPRVNTGRTGGARGERLESNNRTLTVYRPHFAPSSGAQPAASGRPQPSTGGGSRSDIRPGSGGTTTLSPHRQPPARRRAARHGLWEEYWDCSRTARCISSGGRTVRLAGHAPPGVSPLLLRRHRRARASIRPRSRRNRSFCEVRIVPARPQGEALQVAAATLRRRTLRRFEVRGTTVGHKRPARRALRRLTLCNPGQRRSGRIPLHARRECKYPNRFRRQRPRSLRNRKGLPHAPPNRRFVPRSRSKTPSPGRQHRNGRIRLARGPRRDGRSLNGPPSASRSRKSELNARSSRHPPRVIPPRFRCRAARRRPLLQPSRRGPIANRPLRRRRGRNRSSLSRRGRRRRHRPFLDHSHRGRGGAGGNSRTGRGETRSSRSEGRKKAEGRIRMVLVLRRCSE